MFKALVISIKQPFADLIVRGFKTVENRTWKTKYTGPLLIHTGATFEKNWKDFLSARATYEADQFYKRKYASTHGRFKFQHSQIIGAVLMTGVDQNNNNPWCQHGLKYHRYRHPVKFFNGIPFPGQVKLFKAPYEWHKSLTTEDEKQWQFICKQSNILRLTPNF